MSFRLNRYYSTDVQLQEISNIEKHGAREDAALNLLDTLIEENTSGWARTLYDALLNESKNKT